MTCFFLSLLDPYSIVAVKYYLRGKNGMGSVGGIFRNWEEREG